MNEPAPASLPRATIAVGAALAACAALPVTPDGYSFLHLLYAAFVRHPLEGFMMLVGFGSPFLFGLAAAGAGVSIGKGESADYAARVALHVVLAALHTQLLMVAAILVWKGVGVAPWSLGGLALVSGVYFVYRSAKDRAASPDPRGGPSMRFMVRWGASILVAIALWSRLQMLGGLRMGFAIEGILVCALVLNLLVGERRR